MEDFMKNRIFGLILFSLGLGIFGQAANAAAPAEEAAARRGAGVLLYATNPEDGGIYFLLCQTPYTLQQDRKPEFSYIGTRVTKFLTTETHEQMAAKLYSQVVSDDNQWLPRISAESLGAMEDQFKITVGEYVLFLVDATPNLKQAWDACELIRRCPGVDLGESSSKLHFNMICEATSPRENGVYEKLNNSCWVPAATFVECTQSQGAKIPIVNGCRFVSVAGPAFRFLQSASDKLRAFSAPADEEEDSDECSICMNKPKDTVACENCQVLACDTCARLMRAQGKCPRPCR
jgi:hypothetical protein